MAIATWEGGKTRVVAVLVVQAVLIKEVQGMFTEWEAELVAMGVGMACMPW